MLSDTDLDLYLRNGGNKTPRQRLEETIATVFAGEDMAAVTKWLLGRYTGTSTPKNIRYAVDALSDDEAGKVNDTVVKHADHYKKGWKDHAAEKENGKTAQTGK